MPINVKAAARAAPTAASEAPPYTVQMDRASPKSVSYEPSPPFVLFHGPRRYQIDAEGAVIPSLSKMSIEPGIGGVTASGKWAGARAGREEGGEIMIPESACVGEDTPDGHPGYVRRTMTASGPYYHTPWERLEVHAGQGVIVSHDQAGYRRWLEALVTRGIIDAAHPSVIRTLRDQVEATMVAAGERKSHAAAAIAKMCEAQIKGLDALEAP